MARPAHALGLLVIFLRAHLLLQASVTCAATGPISVPDLSRIRGSEGREVFSERKGLSLFRNKVICRLYPALQGPKGCTSLVALRHAAHAAPQATQVQMRAHLRVSS